MIRYKNLGRDSGVRYYEIGDSFIRVKFDGFNAYTYSFKKAGVSHVKNMQALALNGRGLNSYINRHVKYLYD